MNLTFFKECGYIVIEDFISLNQSEELKNTCYSIKKEIVEKKLEGTPKPFGFEKYWKGLDMASTQAPKLYEFYTSRKMYNVAKLFLETKDVYLFNDQIVVKLPKEDFSFAEHTDNQFGPSNQMALNGDFKTITCCIILDDFTESNGPISILNKKTNRWDRPLPKKASMMIWDGNTLHKSDINKSDTERCVWLCIYSTMDLTTISPEIYSKFYNQKLIHQNII